MFPPIHRSWILALVLVQPQLAGCEESCEDIREDAEAAVAERVSCSADDECMVFTPSAHVGMSCLAPFQCDKAINTQTDVQAFADEIEALEGEYARCDTCVQAVCVPADGARCDTATGRCVLVTDEED